MAFEIIYSIRDSKGKQSTTEMNLPDSISLTSAITFAQNMGQLIDAVVTGALTRIGLAFLVDLPAGIKNAPDPDSDVEEGARFQFRTALNHLTGLRLPTFDETKVNVGSDTVDLTDGDVIAFVNSMRVGIDVDPSPTVTTLVEPVDKRGEAIEALEFAREQFLSSRR